MARAVAEPFAARRRAPRFEIEAPVRFWTSDDLASEGSTVNVGRLRMRFRVSCAAVPPTEAVIQLRMALSLSRRWEGAYEACAGRIVRAVRSSIAGKALVATAIDESAFRPAGGENAPVVGSPYAEGAALCAPWRAKTKTCDVARPPGQVTEQ